MLYQEVVSFGSQLQYPIILYKTHLQMSQELQHENIYPESEHRENGGLVLNSLTQERNFLNRTQKIGPH